jgi:hypothetical protein
MIDILSRFGISRIINGNGPVKRLSSGIMAPEASGGMVAASRVTVGMLELQAAASRVIIRVMRHRPVLSPPMPYPTYQVLFGRYVAPDLSRSDGMP